MRAWFKRLSENHRCDLPGSSFPSVKYCTVARRGLTMLIMGIRMAVDQEPRSTMLSIIQRSLAIIVAFSQYSRAIDR